MKAICPYCQRLVFVEYNFLCAHSEDPPSSVICYGSGCYVEITISTEGLYKDGVKTI